MKELTVISGKGGTGKTSVTSAFAALAHNAVMADCDVDAADLHLILHPEVIEKGDFYGGKLASIRKDDCSQCGTCIEVCRFKAVREDFTIDSISCEGCGVCVQFCPEGAIDFKEALNGEWSISKTRFGPLVHARLGIAEENSGKLVTVVRRHANDVAEKEGRDLIIVDGAPGIGCPVISSITGTSAVLIVTEPTLSGQHDLQRVMELTKHFSIPTMVCINKYDLNVGICRRIEEECDRNGLEYVGRIPYDLVITEAMVKGQSVVEYSDGTTSQALKDIWKRVFDVLQKTGSP